MPSKSLKVFYLRWREVLVSRLALRLFQLSSFAQLACHCAREVFISTNRLIITISSQLTHVTSRSSKSVLPELDPIKNTTELFPALLSLLLASVVALSAHQSEVYPLISLLESMRKCFRHQVVDITRIMNRSCLLWEKCCRNNSIDDFTQELVLRGPLCITILSSWNLSHNNQSVGISVWTCFSSLLCYIIRSWFW